MKYLLLIIIASFISCRAQTIVDVHDNSYPVNTPDTYYKDIGDKFNPYEGTWVYDDGVSYIKIVLVKKIKFPVWQYFEDCIIGGFQYKENGIEIINTLNDIYTNKDYPIRYPISGNRFGDLTLPSAFKQYTSDNIRLKAYFKENDYISHMEIRTLVLNGQPAIQIFKKKPMDLHQVCNPVIPNGFYYLIKQ